MSRDHQVGAHMKKILRQIMSPDLRFRAHWLSRFRWQTKYELMRRFDMDVGLRRRLAYVLFDPEIASFSYELENEPEVISGLAAALGHPEAELAAYAAETRCDSELNESLTRHLRWRFDTKRRLPLGNRLPWYVLVRAVKPLLVVETGIYHGLGSLALLRALERNTQEGSPGELMSFDTLQDAGGMVREHLRQGWHRFVGPTQELLVPALENRRVDMLFQDTPHTEENQRFEFGAALANAAPNLLLLDASGGWAPTLEAMCAERNGIYHRVPLRSRDHICSGLDVTFALFTEVENV
jgi:Methyltransferase domain